MVNLRSAFFISASWHSKNGVSVSLQALPDRPKLRIISIPAAEMFVVECQARFFFVVSVFSCMTLAKHSIDTLMRIRGEIHDFSKSNCQVLATVVGSIFGFLGNEQFWAIQPVLWRFPVELNDTDVQRSICFP